LQEGSGGEVMSETCPKCGSGAGTDPEERHWFSCGSHYSIIGPTGEGGFEFIREIDCYDRQLAQQSEVIKDALEVVPKLLTECVPFACCPICETRGGVETHAPDCFIGFAIALIPRLEAALVEDKEVEGDS